MNTTIERPNVIEVDSVTKEFTIRKNKSLKESIVNSVRGAKHTTHFKAANDISFTVKAGESIGLVGANGSGKSTLLKMIGGILTPDSGEVRVRGRIAALLELGAGFHPDLTGRENIYINASILGMSDEEIDEQLDNIIEFSGISRFIDTQVKFYSSGMYVRLAFSVAVHSNPDILLVDEVLAVGDEPFQEKCMDKIYQFKKEGRTIVLVSHSASHITDLCDRAVILDHGTVFGIEEPNKAVQILRDLYDQQQAQDKKAVADIKSFDPGDDPDCVIENVSIIDGLTHDDDSNTEYVTSGTTVSFAFDVFTPRPLTDYFFAFGIRDLQERFIFGLSTLDLNIALPPLDGKTRLVLTLPDFALGAGEYSANFVVKSTDERLLAQKYQALTFSVRNDMTTHGYVFVQPTVSVAD